MKIVEMAARRAPDDPTAELYRKIRDAALYEDGVPMVLRIAVLELVKTEMLLNLQAEIDGGAE